ncbi:hypothetical protein Tco_1063330 [Tanacetum coccineum]
MGTCSRRVSFGLQDFKIGYRRKEQHSIDDDLLKEYTDHKHQTANGRDNGCGDEEASIEQNEAQAQKKASISFAWRDWEVIF